MSREDFFPLAAKETESSAGDRKRGQDIYTCCRLLSYLRLLVVSNDAVNAFGYVFHCATTGTSAEDEDERMHS